MHQEALHPCTQANSSETALGALEKLRPEVLARPAAIKPLLQLLSCGDHHVQRLALNLLAALVATGPEAGDAIRYVIIHCEGALYVEKISVEPIYMYILWALLYWWLII